MTNALLKSIVFIILFYSFAFSQASDPYTIFLLKESNNDVNLEYIKMQEGEKKILDQSEIISLILPFSPGKSGDVLFKNKRNGKIIINCRDGEIKVSTLTPDNSERDLPVVKKENIKEYEIRD